MLAAAGDLGDEFEVHDALFDVMEVSDEGRDAVHCLHMIGYVDIDEDGRYYPGRLFWQINSSYEKRAGQVFEQETVAA